MELNRLDAIAVRCQRPATMHCVEYARRSLRAAEIQVLRIWRERIDPVPADLLPQQAVLIDVHFYFISLRNTYRYLRKIVSDPAFNQMRPQLEALNERWFRHYGKGRDAFEHIDQRLPGEKHEAQVAEIEDQNARRKILFGLSLRSAQFLHSDDRWDISEQTFSRLASDVDEFLRRLEHDPTGERLAK